MPVESIACPNCGAGLANDPGVSDLVCPYCNSRLHITLDAGGRRRPELQSAAPAGPVPPEPPGAEAVAAEIRGLLASDKKIQAIKRYREATDLGLKEAKDAVEAFEVDPHTELFWRPLRSGTRPTAADLRAELLALINAGRRVDAVRLYRDRTSASVETAEQIVNGLADDPQAPLAPAHGPEADALMTGDARDQIRQLLAAGRKIEAIKFYRLKTGLGLKEAKDAVESFERAETGGGALPQVPVARPRGSFGWVRLAYWLAALGLVAFGVYQINQALAETSWPTAPAVITDSWMCHVTVNGQDTYDGPCVGYTYTVGGKQYEYHMEDDPGLDWQKFAWGLPLSSIPSAYSKGREVRVYVDPQNPAVSRLEVGLTPFHFISLVIGALMIGLPLIGLLRAATVRRASGMAG